ncbi:TonB-dependent receptor [Luteimonas sp. FCS-9]|uniref:TonB-dependent receptor n=1 Tax=Luteimonas sp. FCS-9 TaxID=1547516 RepID=UPI00063EC96C|nr:TonB-dependent receptor [Luteimonas sp. FCS-9]KLJ02072.1 TonB-dependent receptor [Luteimonas sp. FCS-9]
MCRLPRSPRTAATFGACLCACLCSVLHAADAPSPASALDAPPPVDAGDPVLTLGRVRVDATRRALDASTVLSSVDVLAPDVLHDPPVAHSWELMARAPGVQVTRFAMGTDAGRFSFRGFNGEGRINAVKLLIDGVPANDNAGGMPYLDAVFPLEIDAIEIVRGTNDARHGLHAIAGSVDVLTRTGGNGGRIAATVGSFDTRELQAVHGIERGGVTQNYAAFWRGSDGERDHADSIQRGASGKWYVSGADARWRVGASLRLFEHEALEAGYLDYETARTAPRSSPGYARDDRSRRRTTQLALHADGRLGAALDWTATAYGNRYRNVRLVRFTAAGAQQERDSDERHHGLLATATWRPAAFGPNAFALEFGVDGQWQDNASRRYRTQAGERLATLRDWDFALDTRGAYVQAIVRPVARLKLVPGYRIDRIGGDFLDVASGQRAPVHRYGSIGQPKLSMAYDLAPGTVAYANWGRTFQIGTGNAAYRMQAGDLAPSLNDGWEAGLKFAPWTGAQARLAYWEQRASGEVATILGVDGTVDAGEVGNVGRTRRHGWDARLDLALRERWQAWLSFARQQARIVVADPAAPQTQGREVENVPRWLATAGIEWQPGDRLRLSAWGHAQGDYFLERSNTLGRTGGRALLDLGATWRLGDADELALQLRNATDRRHVYAWYDSGSSGYSPGEGRTLSLSWRREL